MNATVLALPGAEALAERLRQRLPARAGAVTLHAFPDGERRVRITADVEGQAVVLAAELDRPDEKMLPLLFAAATARELGAVSVGLLAPYLPYMRQDQRFEPGEGVSARYFARLLSDAMDWIVTVDPHLHRIHDLSEVFSVPVETVHAAPALASWIRAHVPRPLVLGPDAESIQWVEEIARLADAPYAVLAKRRLGDLEVGIELPDLAAHAGCRPVLVDDVISTGTTMAAALRLLDRAGWPPAVCLAVHAVFAPGAYRMLRAAGAASIATCNTIPHPSNAVSVDNLLAAAVARRLGTPAAAASLLAAAGPAGR